MLEKLNFFLTGLVAGIVDVKMDGSVLEEKSSFKMLGVSFSSKIDFGSYIVSIAKTASKKLGTFLRSLCLLKLLFISINLEYGLA